MEEYSGKYFIKGFGFLADNNIAKALDEFSHILLKNSDNMEIYTSMGTLFRRNGDYAKAVHIHESALNSPKLPKSLKKYILYELAKDYKQWGQFDKAQSYLSDLIKQDKSPALIKTMAELNFQQANYEEAEKYFIRYEKTAEKDLSIWKAYCHYMKAMEENELKQRIKILEKSLKIYPGLRIANVEYINTLFEINRIDKGIAAVNSFIENDIAASEDDLNNMRNYYYDHRDVKDFDQIIIRKVSSGSPKPFYTMFLSDYFAKKGDMTRAREVIENFVEKYGSFKSLLKKYTSIYSDNVLAEAFINENEFKCSNCGTEYKDYYTICGSCKSLETIKTA